MHRFDADTIAALAEGRLDPEEARELEAQIAANPAAAAELEAHRAALGAIAGAEAVVLSESERQALRSGVASAIGIDLHTAGEAKPDAGTGTPIGFREGRARSIPWPAVAVAGAALLTLAAIVPIAGLLTTQGSDDAAASATVSLAATAPTTIALRDDSGAGEFDASPDSTSLAPTAGDAESLEVPAESVQDTTTTIESAATTETSLVEEPPTLDEATAEELAALRADPEALGQMAAPPLPDTPCTAEASDILGSSDLSVFEFSPTPPPDPSTTTTTATSQPPPEAPRYRIFFTPGADPEQGPGPFVAFAGDSCEAPVTIP